jgi:hypothetical protein
LIIRCDCSLNTSKEDWWLSELHSLGIHPKRINALNDIQELRNLTDNIKQTFYQDYKTCYSEDNDYIVEGCRDSFNYKNI